MERNDKPERQMQQFIGWSMVPVRVPLSIKLDGFAVCHIVDQPGRLEMRPRDNIVISTISAITPNMLAECDTPAIVRRNDE